MLPNEKLLEKLSPTKESKDIIFEIFCKPYFISYAQVHNSTIFLIITPL